MTPRLGTDGTRIVYPVRGIVQVARELTRHPQRRTLAYVLVLIALAGVVAAVLLLTGFTLEAPATVLALAAAAAVAERISVRFAVARRGLTSTEEQSISLLPTLFAAVLFGPLAGGLVGAASMLGDPELIAPRDPDRAPRLKWATYTSTRFVGGVAMGFAAQATLTMVPSEFGSLVAASLVGAVTGEVLDIFFASMTARVRGRPVRDVMRTFVPVILSSAPVYAPVVALLAFMYVRVSPWTLALFLVPAMAAQRLYGLYQEQRRLAVDLSQANETLERANLQFAAALIALVVSAGAVLLLVAGLSPLGNALILPLEDRFPRADLDTPPAPTGFIVLGGAETPLIGSARNVPAVNEAAERLLEAVALSRKFPQAKFAISGGDAGMLYKSGPEAASTGAMLESMGIAQDRLILEPESRDTYENAANLKASLDKLGLTGPGSRWLVITSASHMPRSIGVFRKVGLKVEPWPVDYRTRGTADLTRPFDKVSEGLRRVDAATHEWVGLVAYWLAGRTSSLFPAPEPAAGCDLATTKAGSPPASPCRPNS